MKKLLIPCFFLFVVLGCNPGKDNKISYFDIEKYFGSQITLLDALKPEVYKRVSVDGKEESKTVKDINWKTEFQAFTENNLNKPAWKGRFLVDTIMGEKDYSVVYTALDSTMQLQFAMINIDGQGNVTQVRLKNTSKNHLYSSVQTLSYTPLEGYSIETEQTVFLSGIKRTSVFASFMGKQSR